MPNAHIVKKSLLKTPFKKGDFFYEYLLTSKYDKLIYTKGKDERFFLQLIERKDSYLVKSDKITRPTNVKIVQDAIKYFIEANNAEVLNSNIYSDRNRLVEKSPYQKDIFFYQNFKSDKNVEIEIGFGSGRHILYKAKKYPKKIFIAMEIHRPSIEQLLKQCELQGIENIFVIDYDARILLQSLSSNSIDKIYLHFPVPWDKKPHRRVMSELFLKETIRVLKKSGELEIRTDSEKYFNYSCKLLNSLDNATYLVRKNSFDKGVSSKYEDRWLKMKKDIYEIVFTNQEQSPKREEFEISGFDKKVKFSEIFKKFENMTIKKEDYFVHFENIYEIDDKKGAIKISFGSYDRCEHRYLMFLDEIFYLPSKIVPTKQNFLADKIVKEFIYG